ncbi:MAG: OmpH family outer membrane protein [Owenweeksia sp.]|nr:OmpH family outer membrane protein [Owenweeksia sp.]
MALALSLMIGFSAFAQDEQQKIGHINADALLQMMPETKEAQSKIEAYRDQLEKDLTEMEQELQTKIKSFRENEKMMTNLSRETKTKEIQELQMRIQEYSSKAQEDLQNKQVELLSPLFDKATKAVEKVASENGFTYILDSSDSKAVVIFAGGGIDIMPLVKKEMGLE